MMITQLNVKLKARHLLTKFLLSDRLAFSLIFTIAFGLLSTNLAANAHAENIITDNKPLRIACSANFKPTLEKLISEHEKLAAEGKISIITTSSGILFSQIMQGAPFDIFLSADAKGPKILEEKSDQKSFIYALGKLVYWQPGISIVNQQNLLNLDSKLAIANPKIAPYGIAATEVLDSLKADFHPLGSKKIVLGNNINQTYQFVSSGNASAGLLSLSQMIHQNITNFWLVPNTFYSPIEQRGILLSKDKPEAIAFIRFLESETAKSIIASSGYDLPEPANIKTKQLINVK